MLSRDEKRFDRNGDGRLSGFEYSDYHDYTYGIDDQAKEVAAINEAEDEWADWLNDTATRLIGNYEDVIEPAEIIMGKSTRTRELAEKTYMHFLTLGLLSGSRWHETRSAGGGMYTGSTIFMPYKAVVRRVIERCVSVYTFDDVNNAVMNRSPLFISEGVLTNKNVGSFWRGIYRAMPRYKSNSLTYFGRNARMHYEAVEDEAKVVAVNLLIESLLPVFTYFAGRGSSESLAKCRQYCECFEKHWRDGAW